MCRPRPFASDVNFFKPYRQAFVGKHADSRFESRVVKEDVYRNGWTANESNAFCRIPLLDGVDFCQDADSVLAIYPRPLWRGL